MKKANAYKKARDQFLIDGKLSVELETFPKVGEKFRGREDDV